MSANLTALPGERVPVLRPSALRDLRSEFLAAERGVWELRAQLATDLEVTPVGDASVAWPEDVTRFAPSPR